MKNIFGINMYRNKQNYSWQALVFIDGGPECTGEQESISLENRLCGQPSVF